MRTRATTNLPPITAFLGLVRDQSTTHVHAPQLTHVNNLGQFVQRNLAEIQESSRLYREVRVIWRPVFDENNIQLRRSFFGGAIPEFLGLGGVCAVL
jgi:hypothetical protein